jgi:hypothetical protein
LHRWRPVRRQIAGAIGIAVAIGIAGAIKAPAGVVDVQAL